MTDINNKFFTYVYKIIIMGTLKKITPFFMQKNGVES